MNGVRRVIVFCVLVIFVPAVLLITPLYIKHKIYGTMAYGLIESDVLEINEGISNIFCSNYSLRLNKSSPFNGSFNAFQVSQRPDITSYRKHIRLKKSMILPDDTLEYWGFYLWKGATVALSVCSRFEGASILVVKGEKELRTCGMLDHNKNKALTTGIYLPEAEQVKIIFESDAQEINSEEMMSLKLKEPLHKDNLNELQLNRSDEKLVNMTNSIATNINSYKMINISTNQKISQDVLVNSIQNTTSSETGTKSYLNKQDEINKNNKTEHESKNNSILRKKSRLKALEEELQIVREDIAKEDFEDLTVTNVRHRKKRNHNVDPPVMAGQGIRHGGNNRKNFTGSDDDSSISSFENGLLTCYEGNVLVSREFSPSEKCLDVTYLMNGKHMQTIHNVLEDGYYYYIFYSDNDIVSNDIHAVFDIYKPTMQYENVTKACINQTECSFTLNLFSKDKIIVEIPTRDGIDHELDDLFSLISECYPRMEIYFIFPFTMLIFIIGFAFV